MWRGHSCPRVNSIRESLTSQPACRIMSKASNTHRFPLDNHCRLLKSPKPLPLALHRLRRHPRFRRPELPLRCLRRLAGILFPRMDLSTQPVFDPAALKSLWLNRRTSRDALDQSGVWRFRELLPHIPTKSMPSRCAKATRRCTACHGARARPGSRISTPSTRA